MRILAEESQILCASLLSNCIKGKNLKLGRAQHSYLIKTGLILDTFLANRVIDLYSRCSSTDSAHKMFDDLAFKNAHSWNTMIAAYCQMGCFRNARLLLREMPEPNLVSYNSLISGLSRSGFYKEAIDMFRAMQICGSNANLMDEFTVVGLVNSCACLAELGLLRQVHGIATVMDLDNVVVSNAFIDAYGKCGKVESSYSIFSRMEEKDVVSWNSMVVAYASASRMGDACWIFSQGPVKNVVSWTALIVELVRNGEGEKSLSFFKKMVVESVVPNDITYVSALAACADLAVIGRGKQIHCRVIRIRSSTIFDNVFLINALIDMYSKCGDMISSLRLFERLYDKDIVTWNSILTGLAQNGHGEASISIFEMMMKANVKPNHVTFMAVLSACGHSGLESMGVQLLEMMDRNFNLIPQLEHYSILVDLLGRRNRLKEAIEVIEKSPNGAVHIGMWGSLLSSCRVHANVELATKAAEALFELEPENTGRYVMLSNIYATTGKWNDSGRIRKLMDERNLKKEAGFSWIGIKNARRKFVAEDRFNSDMVEIQELLLNLVGHMKNTGYMHIEILVSLELNGMP
ncbi:pentatricopeptide repeat-containing protein-like [Dorcoceras hygrometricum]|uniref:Pentatricopeptide repeat-containing protein-like n=1 Tax=Dorcoceras hygrometricum TaxID=472368 RepID=A0A2Z7CIM0_9LAMI|nr:pentatricopeptide repeat-containing protein-like [Dorcoceras hygrometricum]